MGRQEQTSEAHSSYPRNFLRNCDDREGVDQYRLHSDFR